MNAWIKGGLIFAVGALAGAGTIYLILDKVYEEKFNQELDDVRSYYRTRIRQLNEVLDKKEEKDSDLSHHQSTENPSVNISQKDYENLVTKDEDGDKSFVDYTSYARHEDISEVSTIHTDVKSLRDELDEVSKAVHDDDFDEHMAERESPEEDDEENEYREMLAENERIADEQEKAKNEGIEPYPITRAEYLNQKSWYEKLSWNFYQDGFVTDDGDEKVLAPEDCLGPNLMEAFGLDGDDPDVAYIRDEQRARDIEVCRVAEDYYPKREVVSDVKLSSEG